MRSKKAGYEYVTLKLQRTSETLIWNLPHCYFPCLHFRSQNRALRSAFCTLELHAKQFQVAVSTASAGFCAHNVSCSQGQRREQKSIRRSEGRWSIQAGLYACGHGDAQLQPRETRSKHLACIKMHPEKKTSKDQREPLIFSCSFYILQEFCIYLYLYNSGETETTAGKEPGDGFLFSLRFTFQLESASLIQAAASICVPLGSSIRPSPPRGLITRAPYFISLSGEIVWSPNSWKKIISPDGVESAE